MSSITLFIRPTFIFAPQPTSISSFTTIVLFTRSNVLNCRFSLLFIRLNVDATLMIAGSAAAPPSASMLLIAPPTTPFSTVCSPPPPRPKLSPTPSPCQSVPINAAPKTVSCSI